MSNERLKEAIEQTKEAIEKANLGKPDKEKVTAKDCFLALIAAPSLEYVGFKEVSEIAHKAAQAFNNYKPKEK